ncbi:MAG: heterodisulfide reductase subunit B [Bacteroidales bacterium]|jgi:heterodisulfide reductase subunit B|nr:heterodisulfide reductase subunit B [Bacteroidales bacterium]MBP9511583.1 heterodisulfide reductase subunit B [Bacteroidales bacterium]MBP9589129.1 heterodisulfide reductase subunit B [Bacteroidales bacterium]MDI9574055.1 heterodisulfide reductase-related iron-sulfur binding cluster [Bacteroidota bacterium]
MAQNYTEPSKKIYWKDYVKNIPDDDYFFFRSCIRQTFFPGAEQAFLFILKNHLHKNYFDDPRLTTCTGIGYHSDIIPLETLHTLIARHFSIMNESGYSNLIISCVTTFGVMTEVLNTWHEFPETLEKTRKNLLKTTGRTFELPKAIAHASDIIYLYKDEIGKQLVYQLVNKETSEPLKVVDHVGCHYSKIFPHHGIGGAEFPKVLSEIIKAWGGEVIDYPERRHCCGFGFRQYLIKESRGYSLSHAQIKFESMQLYHPDFILTNCPGCNMFMDRWQYVIQETAGKVYSSDGNGIPVLSYEELAALLLGYDPIQIGLFMHQTEVLPLLEKLGIQFDKNEYSKLRAESHHNTKISR